MSQHKRKNPPLVTEVSAIYNVRKGFFSSGEELQFTFGVLMFLTKLTHLLLTLGANSVFPIWPLESNVGAESCLYLLHGGFLT